MMLTSAEPQEMRWVLAERVLPRRQRHSQVKKHKERRRQKNFGRLCISHSSHSCAWLSLESVQGRGLWWHVCSCIIHWSGTQSRGRCMEWRAWCPSSWQNVKLKAKLSPESTEVVNLLSGYAAWLFKRRKILSRVAQVVLGSKLKGHMSCFPHELVTISPSLGQQIRVLAASFCGLLFVTNDQNCFDEHNLKSTSPAWKQCAGAPFLIFQLLYGHSYLHAVSTQLKVWEILSTPLCRRQTALDCLGWKNGLLWSVTMILVAYVM